MNSQSFSQYVLDEDALQYGTPRHSGRYPWGSGDKAYQHHGDFLSRREELRKTGLSEKEIAEAMGCNSTSQLRAKVEIARDYRRAYDIDRIKSLMDKGYSKTKIGEIMGVNESTVRSMLDENSEARTKQLKGTVNFLKDQIDKKGYIEVGTGVELSLNISDTKLKTALAVLKEEGYVTINPRVDQVTNPGKKTTMTVLCPKGMTEKEAYKEVINNLDKIQSIEDNITRDGGTTWSAPKYPVSIDPKRIFVRYDEDGGTDRDGTVELRRGVEDLSLGKSHYAQVRIAVNDSHYIKGMALYSDDIPKGYDIVINSNKKRGTPLLSDDPDAKQVLKPFKRTADGVIDRDNPFGALIKAGGQEEYTSKDGSKKQSAINKLREEGEWDDYSRNLASQFLSKQKIELIQRQLNLSYAQKEAEFNEIKSLTNPIVKKSLLEGFADECDAAAVHLKAAALPRQSTKVLLPVPQLKDNEVYAPTYKNGERVCLVRFPHGGLFEIPELVVNNTNPQGKSILGNARDAIGINPKVAGRLSGADFDGDTAVVIPVNSKVKISTMKPLAELEGFDNKASYPYREGMKVMTKNQLGKEMGKISNLITDMTLAGADKHELARAVRHSMVVIDAHKHKLDYKQSELDNDIESLKKKYQQNDTNNKGYGGASTLISRAKSEKRVPERKMFYYSPSNIDPDTGEKKYTLTNNTKRTGELVLETSTRMRETKDAYSLVSTMRNEKELAYADYANKLKALANETRKEWLNTGNLTYSPDANKVYAKEVESLNAQLKVALSNKPKERRAQAIANSIVKAKQEDNPDMDKDELKKAKSQALAKARVITGANKIRIDISEKEWEAIQAGAITSSKLKSILDNTDSDKVRELATPKATTKVTTAMQSRIKAMASSGATLAQIASALGVSPSTVGQYLNE